MRNQSCWVKRFWEAGLDSCLLIDIIKFFRPAKAVTAFLTSIWLLQSVVTVVSLRWSRTKVSRVLYSSAGRWATHANVVANNSVAVELVLPTTWKGRLSLSLFIFLVAANTPSTTLRKSVSSKVFSPMQYRRREERSGSISGTLVIMVLNTSDSRAISSAQTGGISMYATLRWGSFKTTSAGGQLFFNPGLRDFEELIQAYPHL